jgi:peptidoglycan/LPS O-acetylase OafA/YrhL
VLFAHHPLARLPDFVLGVIAGTLFIRRPASACGSGVAAVAAVVGVLGLLGTLGTELPSLYANALLLPLFAALVYALGRGGGMLGRGLSQPLVVLLGEASYAIYILQDPAWRIGIALVRRVTGSTALTETGGYFVGFALVLIGLSVFSLYVVERPGRRLLRRVLGRQPRFPARVSIMRASS